MVDILYYNCDDPLAILKDCELRTSNIFAGVSLSHEYLMASHGPFKIAFKHSKWFDQCQEVRYFTAIKPGLKRLEKPTHYQDQHGIVISTKEFEILHSANSRIYKNTMFSDEYEFYSAHSIKFEFEDIIFVEYMTNAPCGSVGPIKLKRIIKALKEIYPALYRENFVDDPYLKK